MKNSQKSVGSKHFGFQAAAVISLALALCSVARAQNAVTAWNDIAVTAALKANQTISPASSTAGGMSIYLAYTHLAIYNAVNAIDHRFQPYGAEIPAPGGGIGRCRSHLGGIQHPRFLFTGSISFSDGRVHGEDWSHPRWPGERRRSAGRKGGSECNHCHASGRWPRCECALCLSVCTDSRSLDSDPTGTPFRSEEHTSE